MTSGSLEEFRPIDCCPNACKKKIEKSLLASVYTEDKNEIKIGNRQGYLDQFLQVHVLCMGDHQAVRNFYGRK